jgi:DNA-binding IscR family transcriptional regulator
MRINTRFPVAIHILSLLALNKDKPNTSELLARSVNTNPVVIRRIIAQLKKKGLLSVRPGVGGAELLDEPGKINLLDVYNAVKTPGDPALFDVHKNPNPRCFVGANIHDALGGPLSDAQRAMEEKLASYTLLDVIRPIAERTNASGYAASSISAE